MDDKEMAALYMELPEKYRGLLPSYLEIPNAWAPLLDRLCAAIRRKQEGCSVHLGTVKEKFGALRIYTDISGYGYIATNQSVERIDKLVAAAERVSCHVCMTCGKPGIWGRMYGPRGWMYTLCEEHWRGDRWIPPKDS